MKQKLTRKEQKRQNEIAALRDRLIDIASGAVGYRVDDTQELQLEILIPANFGRFVTAVNSQIVPRKDDGALKFGGWQAHQYEWFDDFDALAEHFYGWFDLG